jgi:hypothetical protein
MSDTNQIPSLAGVDSGQPGIGNYNTISNLDLMFAFDYRSAGKVDHVVVYRPGSGICWILENQNQEPTKQAAVYQPVYNTGDPGNGVNGKGIGGYDLADTNDRMFAFDLEGSGKLDDLVLYRPGPGTWEGICWILQNDAQNPGNFSVAYKSSAPGQGIGSYNLSSYADRMFAFDLDGTGKLDDLVCYRPGEGICFLLQNSATTPGDFSVAYSSPVVAGKAQGIGGYLLDSPYDRAFAFDYDGSGKPDDLAMYRPGAGTFWVLENQLTTPASFLLPYPPPPPEGIGGYPLTSTADQVFAFDYEGNGNLDDLVLFQPGQGTIWVLQNTGAAPPKPPTFTVAFQEPGNPPLSVGIAGFDLFGTVDQGTTIDFSGVGRMDYLLFYRPGTGTVTILKNNRTTPGSFDPTPYQAGSNSVTQVQQNLNNIIALNDTLFTNYSSPEISAAYYLLTGSGSNSTNWPISTGLSILSGAFAAVAAAIGTITGIAGIVAGSVAFIACFAPGMISDWLEGASTPSGNNPNDTVAGLVLSFQSATNNVNKQLGDFANDVAGNWTQSYTFNNQTQVLSNLANLSFPSEGPAYDFFYSTLSAQYLLQIWQTILKADYKITEFQSVYLASAPDPSYYAEYYQQNPAYLVNYVQPTCGFYNIGTGVSHWFGGNGDMAQLAAEFLFSNFDRGAVFWLWGIPVASMATWPAPGPMPPGSE